MVKTTIAAALLIAGFAGAAHAGGHRYNDADRRAFVADYERQPDRGPALAPAQPVSRSYQDRFGAFSSANMARNLGF